MPILPIGGASAVEGRDQRGLPRLVCNHHVWQFHMDLVNISNFRPEVEDVPEQAKEEGEGAVECSQ